MAIYKPESQKQKQPEKQRSLVVPLLVVAGVVILIGIIVLAVNKAQSKDPTLTAAPPTGVPGQIYHASPEKMQKQQQIRAKMDAEIGGIKAASH